jgi:hypothetical protein
MAERLGRIWKLIVVVAAGVSALSFVLPYLRVDHDPADVPVSAYRILIGFDDVAQIDPALRRLPAREQAEVLDAWNATVRTELKILGQTDIRPQASRVPYFYAGAALLLIVAAIAIARRELGFFASLATMAGGLIGVWGWTRELLRLRHILPGDFATTALSSGAHLSAVAGAIALVAGVGALIWPDPGGFRAPRKISVQLQRGEGPVAIDMPTVGRGAAIPTATLRSRAGRSRGDAS